MDHLKKQHELELEKKANDYKKDLEEKNRVLDEAKGKAGALETKLTEVTQELTKESSRAKALDIEAKRNLDESKSVQQRLRDAVEAYGQARKLAEKEDYNGAQTAIERAVTLDRENIVFQDFRNTIAATKERKERKLSGEKLYETARRAFTDGQHTQARETVQKALELLVDDERCKSLKIEIETAIDEGLLRQTEATMLLTIDKLLEEGDYAEALRLKGTLMSTFDKHPLYHQKYRCHDMLKGIGKQIEMNMIADSTLDAFINEYGSGDLKDIEKAVAQFCLAQRQATEVLQPKKALLEKSATALSVFENVQKSFHRVRQTRYNALLNCGLDVVAAEPGLQEELTTMAKTLADIDEKLTYEPLRALGRDAQQLIRHSRKRNLHIQKGKEAQIAGRFSDAAIWYMKALEVHPLDIEAHLLLGDADARSNRLDTAVRWYERGKEVLQKRINEGHCSAALTHHTPEIEQAMIVLQKRLKSREKPSQPRIETFSGTWEGTFKQAALRFFGLRVFSRTYPVTLTVNSLERDKIAGSISYPTLPCGGILTFLGQRENRYTFREGITNGRTDCYNGGIVHITIKGSEATCEWQYPDGKNEGFGVLKRRQ